MKAKNLFLIGLVATLWSCAETKRADGWEVTIKGKVNFPQKGKILIREMKQGLPAAEAKPMDSIVIKSGNTFEKKIRITSPGYFQIDFYSNQIINVILDKSNVEINVDGNSPQGFAEVKGSPDMDLIDRVQDMLRVVQESPAAKAIEQEFQQASQQGNQTRVEELQRQYMSLMDKANADMAASLGDQPPSLGLIHVLQNAGILDPDKYMTLYINAAEKFKKEWPGIQYGADFVSFVEKLKATAIGQPAPEISLPDPNGKILTLSSFKGKYVLVDFWAKWCGPCRRENPNVVKAYNKFKGKAFDILGVSLDRNKADWLQGIQEDGLVWNHVSDLKYFESQAARDYNINGIPFSILVDPNGIIIAKNLRGTELHKKLEEVLK